MKEKIVATRQYREQLLTDPYRPVYHFAVPDDNGYPGDPNGAFFADGVYHLMYLYHNSGTKACHWGHMTSVDLLHWRHHLDALQPDMEEGGERSNNDGCFSGGAFVDEDKTAYLTYWKYETKGEHPDNGGIAIAASKPPYEKWEKIAPVSIESNADEWGVVDIPVDGDLEHVACADPSNIWKADGWYYMALGNLPVLDKYGRAEDSDPHYRGDWADLFRSKDMKNWSFVHRFYTNPHAGEDWPDRTEDCMCPSFLPLYDARENGKPTGKYLNLFIAHNKGCQYYIGTLEKETFLPETHGRMSWKDRTFFAPEALIDDRGRHIMWAWILDNAEGAFKKYGWTGVYCFPRVLWLEDGRLRMAPAEELDKLEYNRTTPAVAADNSIAVNDGSVFRLKAKLQMEGQDRAGFALRIDPESGEQTEIYYDKPSGKLVFDATRSGCAGFMIREEAPFCLEEGETLSLDIFVDKAMVEVYANERQAICRRVYPTAPERAVGLRLIGRQDAVQMLRVCDMAPTNPY